MLRIDSHLTEELSRLNRADLAVVLCSCAQRPALPAVAHM